MSARARLGGSFQILRSPSDSSSTESKATTCAYYYYYYYYYYYFIIMSNRSCENGVHEAVNTFATHVTLLRPHVTLSRPHVSLGLARAGLRAAASDPIPADPARPWCTCAAGEFGFELSWASRSGSRGLDGLPRPAWMGWRLGWGPTGHHPGTSCVCVVVVVCVVCGVVAAAAVVVVVVVVVVEAGMGSDRTSSCDTGTASCAV